MSSTIVMPNLSRSEDVTTKKGLHLVGYLKRPQTLKLVNQITLSLLISSKGDDRENMWIERT